MDETRDRRPLHGAAWLAGVGAALATLAVCAAMQVRAADKAAPGSDASSVIEISAKLIEVDRRNATAAALLDNSALKPGGTVLMPDAQAKDFMEALNKQKGVDLLSAPRVMTLSGQQATIEIVGEFVTPDRAPDTTPKEQKVGVFLTLLPQLDTKDGIKLSLAGLVRDFDGFRDDPATGKKLPVFLERKTKSELVFAKPDTTAVLMSELGPESQHEKGVTTRIVLYVISTRVVTQAGVQAVNNHGATTITPDGKVSTVTNSSTIQSAAPGAADTPKMKEKATKIIFTHMEFLDATLDEALDFLRVKSKELDPEKQGVNIILADPVSARDLHITLSLTNVPLTDALRYVTELAGRKFRYDEHAVTITRSAAKPAASTTTAAADKSSLLQRAEAIILPRVEFQEATVAECVEFLRAKSTAMRNPDGESLAVNIVLKVPKDATLPKVTLSLRDLSLSETLRYVAELAGLMLGAEENAFVLEPK